MHLRINITHVGALKVKNAYVGSADLTDDETLQLIANGRAFTSIRAKIEQFHVEDCLRALRKDDVLDGSIQLQLVGEKDSAQMRSTSCRYLIGKNNLVKYTNFIKVCNDIDPQLAKSILTTIQLEIKLVGLPECFNPPP